MADSRPNPSGIKRLSKKPTRGAANVPADRILDVLREIKDLKIAGSGSAISLRFSYYWHCLSRCGDRSKLLAYIPGCDQFTSGREWAVVVDAQHLLRHLTEFDANETVKFRGNFSSLSMSSESYKAKIEAQLLDSDEETSTVSRGWISESGLAQAFDFVVEHEVPDVEIRVGPEGYVVCMTGSASDGNIPQMFVVSEGAKQTSGTPIGRISAESIVSVWQAVGSLGADHRYDSEIREYGDGRMTIIRKNWESISLPSGVVA